MNLKIIALGLLAIFCFAAVVLFLTKPDEPKAFAGSCKKSCPDIDSGMNCGWHTTNDTTPFKFKHQGFCGDLKSRFRTSKKTDTVYDRALKGEWFQRVGKGNQPQAYQFCESQEGNSGNPCRLPSVSELVSLLTVKMTPKEGFTHKKFKNTGGLRFCSQTPLKNGKAAWFVDYKYGIVSYMPGQQVIYARCFCPRES